MYMDTLLNEEGRNLHKGRGAREVIRSDKILKVTMILMTVRVVICYQF